MSDGIEIGISTQYDGAGVSSALRDTQRLSAIQKDWNNLGVTSSAITGNWSQAQLTAAKHSVMLADKQSVLAKAVERGHITLGQAQEAWQRYNKTSQGAIWSQMTLGEKLSSVATRYQDLVSKAKPYLLMAGSVATATYAVGKAVEKAWDFSEQGAQIQFTQQKFSNLSDSIGTTSHSLLYGLKTATKGVYSNMQLMGSATDFVGLGLAKTRDEAVRLSAVSAGLGMNMNQLVLTLTNKTTMRFDALGVKVDGFKEKVNALKAAGMDADSAFKEAFLQQAESQLKLVGNVADTNAGSFMQLRASWANYTDSIKTATGGMFTAPNLSIASALNNAANTNVAKSDYRNYLSSYAGISDPSQSSMFTNNRGGVFDASAFKAEALRFQNMMNRGSAMTSYYQNLQASMNQGQAINQNKDYLKSTYAVGGDYGSMLKGGLQLTDMQGKFGEASRKLNIELQQQQDVLAKLRQSYPDTSSKVQEQIGKVNALKQAVIQNNNEQTKSQKQYASSVLETKGATLEQQLAFAVASGQITQGAANQQQAQDKLAEAFANGSLSATTYASGLEALMSKVKNMNGKSANMYVDVWIREHTIQSQAAALASITNEKNNETGGHSGRHGGEITDTGTGAGGGQMKGWTLVGDLPGGKLTPYSELISPWGYVYDAKTTRALMQTGLFDGATPLAVGGDSYTRGGSGSALSRSRGAGAARTFSRTKTQRGGTGSSIISTAAVTGADIMTQSAADVAQSQVNLSNHIQNQTNAVLASNTIVSSKLDELIGVMLEGNPQAIGKKVGFEIAKVI